MAATPWPASLAGYRIHLVGIKGTGLAALAEILVSRGAAVSGSDIAETFYTDAVLSRLGIPYKEGFDVRNLGPDVQLVVHSAAYSRDEHPELRAAVQRGLPVLSYPEALGCLSAAAEAAGIAGTHGKTTTTALSGVLCGALELPATVLAGSEVLDFGGRSTLLRGERYFIAETCEYRRHFLHFRPRRAVVTSVEADHLDYFRDLQDVLAAFTEYALLLPTGGTLIFCADDAGARTVAERLRAERRDVRFVPYGETAEGPFRVEGAISENGRTAFRLAGAVGEFTLCKPGRHLALDAAAALALATDLLAGEGRKLEGPELEKARSALEAFRGSRRRSEVLGEAGGVLFMDDYGHHPTEIRVTLEGLKSFYPGRRLVVDFMSHTYTRTRALLPEFATCFAAADEVVLHRIYASAREQAAGGVDGRALCRAVSANHPAVQYFEEPLDAVTALAGQLKRGDLFLTMGAGDNWKVGQALYRRLGGNL